MANADHASIVLPGPGLALDLRSILSAVRGAVVDGAAGLTAASVTSGGPVRTTRPRPAQHRSSLRFRGAQVRGPRAAADAVLLVGGEAAQQRFCESFLQTLSLRVVATRSFHDGMRALATASYRVVIVDALTRGFDAEVWSRLVAATAAKGGSAPQVYLVTDANDGRGGRAAGAASRDCIKRPIRAIDLVRMIERMAP